MKKKQILKEYLANLCLKVIKLHMKNNLRYVNQILIISSVGITHIMFRLIFRFPVQRRPFSSIHFPEFSLYHIFQFPKFHFSQISSR